MGQVFYLPTFYQIAYGYSPVKSAILLLPLTVLQSELNIALDSSYSFVHASVRLHGLWPHSYMDGSLQGMYKLFRIPVRFHQELTTMCRNSSCPDGSYGLSDSDSSRRLLLGRHWEGRLGTPS
jgi:hypothetical protein